MLFRSGFGVHSHHQEDQNDLCYLDLEEWLLPALGLFPDTGTRFQAFLGDESSLGWQHCRSPRSPHPCVKLQSWLPCLWPLSSFLDSHLPLTSARSIFLSTLLPGLSPSRHGECWESSVLAWCPCLALSRLSALFQLSVCAPLVLL